MTVVPKRHNLPLPTPFLLTPNHRKGHLCSKLRDRNHLSDFLQKCISTHIVPSFLDREDTNTVSPKECSYPSSSFLDREEAARARPKGPSTLLERSAPNEFLGSRLLAPPPTLSFLSSSLSDSSSNFFTSLSPRGRFQFEFPWGPRSPSRAAARGTSAAIRRRLRSSFSFRSTCWSVRS